MFHHFEEPQPLVFPLGLLRRVQVLARRKGEEESDIRHTDATGADQRNQPVHFAKVNQFLRGASSCFPM